MSDVAADSVDCPLSPDVATPVGSHLPCGQDIDELLELIAENEVPRPGAHVLHCPHCQQAAEEFRHRWARVPATATAPVFPSPDLAASVVALIRAGAAPDNAAPLDH